MNIRAQVANPVNADQVNLALTGNLRNIIAWSSPNVVTSLGAGAAITAAHNLGTVPSVIHVEPWVDSRVWADEDDRRVWNAKTITFHVSAATGRFTVYAGVR